MTDEEFLAQFESCSLDEFHHRDHIRMAWLYLRKYGFEEGSKRIIMGIKSFAASKNQHRLYHETITLFWIHAVAHHVQEDPELSNFSDFLLKHPQLMDGKFIYHHYSSSLLQSAHAKTCVAEPDLRSLPFAM